MTWKQIRKKLSKKIEVNEIEIYLLFKLKVVVCVLYPPFENGLFIKKYKGKIYTVINNVWLFT